MIYAVLCMRRTNRLHVCVKRNTCTNLNWWTGNLQQQNREKKVATTSHLHQNNLGKDTIKQTPTVHKSNSTNLDCIIWLMFSTNLVIWSDTMLDRNYQQTYHTDLAEKSQNKTCLLEHELIPLLVYVLSLLCLQNCL